MSRSGGIDVPALGLPLRGLLCLGLIALGLVSALPAGAEILPLPSGQPAGEPARFCLAGPEAVYSWSEEESPRLQPERGLFSYFQEGQVPLWPELDLPGEVSRGDSLQALIVLAEPLDGLTARLSGGEGEPEVEAQGFALRPDGRAWAVLLGVASTAQAGERSIVLLGRRGERVFEIHAPVRVLHREFESESIAFNQPLTELMTIPDPRKEEEYRRLLEVLGRHDPRGVHHLQPLIVPVQYTRRTSGFADRRVYRYTDGGSSRSLHNGVDLAAPVGTPVSAAGAGRVVMAADRLLAGLTVVLEHLPGVYSLYYHLDSLAVQESQRVEQGQRIGTVGMTGLATGPHLHWEVRVAGTAVDPDSLVEGPLVDDRRLLGLEESLYMGLRGVELMLPQAAR